MDRASERFLRTFLAELRTFIVESWDVYSDGWQTFGKLRTFLVNIMGNQSVHSQFTPPADVSNLGRF